MAFNHNNGHDPAVPPQAPGLATDPYAPFLPWAPTPYPYPYYGVTFAQNPANGADLKFPTTINAIHMSLIPKGPNRGKVLVWDDFPVVLKAPAGSPFDPANFYAYQAYSILDPSPLLGPTDIRFQNFLLPLSPVTLGSNYGEDLFCAGHTWSNFGDLVVVGGTHFSVPAGTTSGSATWVFNPNLANQPFPGNPASSHFYGTGLGFWVAGPQLQSPRYYPTALLTNQMRHTTNPNDPLRERILVLGGGIDPIATPVTWNTYEAIRIDNEARILNAAILDPGISTDVAPGQVSTWIGPGTAGGSPLLDWLIFYPRAHLIDDGSPLTKVFVSGFPKVSAYLEHESTQSWNVNGPIGQSQPLPQTSAPPPWNDVRFYGASVRYPNTDGNDNRIVRLGGYRSQSNPVAGSPDILFSTKSVEVCQTDLPQAAWEELPSMHHSRAWPTAVVLPDASIVAFGGVDLQGVLDNPPQYPAVGSNPPGIAVYEPEYLTPGASSWTTMTWAPAQSIRDYHSTALLLPDGRVLVAGGNYRWGNNTGVDYELFSPPYMDAIGAVSFDAPGSIIITGTQPAPNEPNLLSYGTQFTVQCSNSLSIGSFLQRAVLMAPGSTTHHSDMSERFHQLTALAVKSDRTKMLCTAPSNDHELPRGYYMLFALTNTRKVSSAAWVLLQ